VTELSLLPSNGERRISLQTVEFRRFSELKDVPPEPPWLWRGYLAPGSLTMLAGHPFAGKSMLVAGLLKAMETGEPFLGQTIEQGSALLITEEDDAALRARAGLFGLLELESEYVGRSSGVLSPEWPDLVTDATDHARENGHRLLVIDTFPGLAGLHDEQENDAGAISERLRPLQAAAGKGLAVLFLHHMNGQGQPRGSKAFRGIVDTSIRFLRRGKTSAFRLEAESRFPTSTPSTLRGSLVQSADRWIYTRVDGKDDSRIDARANAINVDERLRQALVRAGADGITYAEFDRIEGLSRDKAKKRLPRLYDEKEVSRSGEGTKRDPYRWLALSA
jgi:AAA domain